MNPDQLAAADLELAAASRQAGKEALFALAPAVMALVGWLGVRKQRHAVRAALAAQQVSAPEAGPSVAGGIDPASVEHGRTMVEVALPDWAELVTISDHAVVVERGTGRLVTSFTDRALADIPDGEAANLMRWAASLHRPS